jgi:RNA ligase
MFPVIKTIDDILPHIQGNDNFHVNKKDDYIVIDYILNTPETFNNPYEKECRGIIFYEDGRIMARRLHKFFNVNERDETKVENIDFSKPHWILEKLDGSMITKIFSNGKLQWASKAGITFLTSMVEEFVNSQEVIRYNVFCEKLFEKGYTAIFEFCSNKNRIVIEHLEDKLILIAIRNNISGEYINIHS